MQAGVWNAQVLLRELRERNYGGGYSILTEWLRPQRTEAFSVAVRRFETPPGKQAQVDWGHLGSITEDGQARMLWGFAITLGYSRRMMAEAATDQKLGTLLRMHESAFQEWGAVPEAILYDRMRTIWTGADERGEIIWNAVSLDFARYWFHGAAVPSLPGPDQRQSGIGHEVCASQLPVRIAGTRASESDRSQRRTAPLGSGSGQQRVHGTAHQQVLLRGMRISRHAAGPEWAAAPYLDDEQRRVARDAYVSWHGSRYSAPWLYAGKEVWVRDHGHCVEVRYGAERIAVHCQTAGRYQVVTQREHPEGIPLGNKSAGKTLIHIQQSAPMVERRALAAYESLAGGAL